MEIKVGDQFYYWKVIELIGSASALCLCTGCGKVEKKLWFCKLIKGTSRSCGCKNNEFRKQKALAKYGVENISQAEDVKKRKVETTIKNHGVSFPMQSKKIKEKSKQTLLSTLGVEHNSQLPEIKLKKQTSFVLQNQDVLQSKKQKLNSLYGADNYLSVPEHRTTIKEKLKELYGVDNPSQSTLIKQKKKQSSLDRYGTEHPQQSKELRIKRLSYLDADQKAVVLSDGRYLTFACDQAGILNKSHAYNLFRFFGEEVVVNYINNYNKQGSTDLEDRFIQLMKPYFPNLEKYNKKPTEGSLNYRPDFRLEYQGKVLYVNVDGLYYHSELMIEDKNYHFKMREAFEKNNIRLMQFRADELWGKGNIVQSIILSYFGLYNEKISARNCRVVAATKQQADDFFTCSHLMGTHSAFKGWGLEYQGIIVCCLSVREFNKHIEICRFSTKLLTSVRGGFSKLLTSVSKLYNKPIVSYCDLRYANGDSYLKLNFDLASVSQSWQWTDLKQVFSRYYCRASMDARALSEREYAKQLAIYKIYDAGQAKFIKKSFK